MKLSTKDDRDYQVGDILCLRQTTYTEEEMASGLPLQYTGLSILVVVKDILRGPIYGLEDGYVIMSVCEIL
jgi:hypothetical protein